MGLLDDAIREHMELKRLRGADPGEVARMERDALGPVVREHDDLEQDEAFEDVEHGDQEHGREDQAAHPDRLADFDPGHTDLAYGDGTDGNGDGEHSTNPHPERGPDFANVGQETAELDMRTVLDGEPEDGVVRAPSIPGETPGQERLWFDRQQQQAAGDFDFDP